MSLPKELLAKVYEIEIITKKRTDDLNPGSHPSVFLGEGFDFEEHREYSPGDDIKKIDWHLLARIPDKVYVKYYRETKQLTIWILADLSASMRFGFADLTKKELMIKSMAYLGFSAAHELDKVGAILFAEKIKKQLRPKNSKSWVHYMLNETWDFSCSKNTDIVKSLKEARNYLRKSDIVFLLSDFLDNDCLKHDSSFWQEIRNMVGLHDLIPVVLEEDESFLLNVEGNLSLKDLESGKRINFRASNKNRDEFIKTLQERHKILRKLFIESGTRAIFIKSDVDMDKFLKFFLIRKKRRG
jgi:uncharacterized protein (DUF58 family)